MGLAIPPSAGSALIGALLLAAAMYGGEVQSSVPPTPDAVLAVYDRALVRGEVLHETVVSTAIWTDSATTLETWDVLNDKGVHQRRSQASAGAKGADSITLITATGMWQVLPKSKRAVLTPTPKGDLDAASTGPEVKLYAFASWKSLGVAASKVEGKPCWALSQAVPDDVRESYRKQAEDLKTLAGVEDVGPFIPKVHKIVVDDRCSAVVATEYIADNGVVVASDKIKSETVPLDPSFFEIPAGYELARPATFDEFFRMVKE